MPKSKLSIHSQFTLPPEVVGELRVGKNNEITITESDGRKTYTVNGKEIASGKVKTIVNFILDKSGSMSSITDSVISGFNEYLNTLKKNKETDVEFSLTLFDTDSIEKRYVSTPISKVKELNRETYVPMSMTNLYDAVCKTVKEVEKQLEDENNYASVVVIMTDGQENSSTEYTERDLSKLREKLEETGKWTFVYMGANQDSWSVAQKFGISRGNTIDWLATSTGTQDLYRSLANATSSYMVNASLGTTSTKDFFDKN